MVTSVTSARPATSSLIQTQVSALSNAASAEARNVTRGAVTLFTVTVDNQAAAASNTKVWIKLYDDISNSWAPGTTKAKLGFPIEAWTAADGSQAIGTYQVMHSRSGVLFDNGISLAAAQTPGDDATAAPATNVLAELTHS
jgi:hypothetical protein